MKVSLKWLQDYVNLALPTQELVEKLTMSGTEVSGTEVSPVTKGFMDKLREFFE